MNSNYKKLADDFEAKQKIKKDKIKQEPNILKRILKYAWHFAVFPWQWIWVNIRDITTAIIFFSTVAVLGSGVWLPYLLALITGNNWLYAVGSAWWIFWIGPGTPFMVISIGLTITIKALINKLRLRGKYGRRNDKNN